MFKKLLLASSLLAGLATSQTIDPEDIEISTRDQWCLSQTESCPLICLQLPGASIETQQNECDPDTLHFSCVCSNGVRPNASEFTETIPYFLCTERNNRCVENCAQGDSLCQASCREDNPCGAQNPRKGNGTKAATPTTATSTATGEDVVYTGFGKGSASDDTDAGVRGAVLEIGRVYGTVALVAGLIGGAALVL
ncbi:hypothetical protein VTN31DRAFT_3581 [Thermomyces dupontii]|uniref:uncharacterized protein n=1 Tax=Talaromyces thermophilus TaxID=28565 RepID=UPI003743C3D2